MAVKKNGQSGGDEPKRKAAGKRKSKQPRGKKDLVDYRCMKALSKKERVEIFAILCERIASPVEIAAELGEGLSQVSYHVKVLRECGLIEKDHEVPRRGAVEHFYRAITPTLIPPNAWKDLPSSLREGMSVKILQEFFEDASAAMKSGVFESPPGELCLTPLILDSQGIEKFGELGRDFLEAVIELQADASKRLKGELGKAKTATVFLATFLSARSPKEGQIAAASKRR